VCPDFIFFVTLFITANTAAHLLRLLGTADVINSEQKAGSLQ
jgi:hypothetical protein